MKKKIICFGLGRIYQTFLALYDSSKVMIPLNGHRQESLLPLR